VTAVVRWFLQRQKGEREHGEKKLLSVARESAGILHINTYTTILVRAFLSCCLV
jgi:hypothetical protein